MRKKMGIDPCWVAEIFDASGKIKWNIDASDNKMPEEYALPLTRVICVNY